MSSARKILALVVAMVALGSFSPVDASTASTPRAEHKAPGPAHPRTRFLDQRPVHRQGPLAAGQDAAAPFLTRPYWNPHYVTSVFDHCNPDYTQDGMICEDDGTVAYRSNGVDPSFSSGYAITPGGGDYLYYDGHNGWDLALNYETLLAAADGTVNLAGSDPYNPGFGQTVTIDHHNGFTTRYAHMSQIWVSPGQNVVRGQQIGISGNTGYSTGPHLHFGVYLTAPWIAIDPWGWSGAGTDPWPYEQGNLWFWGNPQNPVPWAPDTVTAGSMDGSALVSWSVPRFDGGTAINAYTVTATPGGATVTVGAGTTSTVFTGLANGTTYSFTVAATDSVGTGPASAPSNSVMVGAAWPGQTAVVTAARILDTRSGVGGVGTLGPNQAVDITVLGRGGIPTSGVAAVELNLAVTNAAAAGYLRAFASGAIEPDTSNLNFVAGQTVADLVTATLGPNGLVRVRNGSPGSLDLVADVEGWIATSAATAGGSGRYTALQPARLVDTRSGSGSLRPGQSLTVAVGGNGGVPVSGASAVVLNVTAANPQSAGYMSLYPTGGDRPPTSDLNFRAGQTVGELVIVKLGAGGGVDFFNGGTGSVDIVTDLIGWYS